MRLRHADVLRLHRCHMVLSLSWKEAERGHVHFSSKPEVLGMNLKIIIKSWLVFNISPSGNCCTSDTAGVAVYCCTCAELAGKLISSLPPILLGPPSCRGELVN